MWRIPSTFFSRLLRNRSLRFTSEGTRFLIFTLAVGVAAVNTGNNLFYLLLAMMLSLIVMSGLLSEICLRRLEFRRQLPDYIFANSPVPVSLLVVNRKRYLPSFSLRFFDVVDGHDIDRKMSLAHMAPCSSILVTYSLVARHRGIYRLTGLRAATPFPFGLFHKKTLIPLDTTTTVCPELTPLPAALSQVLAALGQEQGLVRRGPGMALYNLREYQPGDDSRAIHWMTTARTSKLMIKETEAEDQQRVTIFLSLLSPVADEDNFEHAVSVTASLLTLFHQRNYLTQAIIGNETFSFATGEDHYTEILRTLALCRPREPLTSEALGRTVHRPMSPQEDSMRIAIFPWADPAVKERLSDADCVITVTGSKHVVYESRSRVLS
ncbi:MAG: DUF58 domain-containing protein [Nitrospiraceae bacterium]